MRLCLDYVSVLWKEFVVGRKEKIYLKYSIVLNCLPNKSEIRVKSRNSLQSSNFYNNIFCLLQRKFVFLKNLLGVHNIIQISSNLTLLSPEDISGDWRCLTISLSFMLSFCLTVQTNLVVPICIFKYIYLVMRIYFTTLRQGTPTPNDAHLRPLNSSFFF